LKKFYTTVKPWGFWQPVLEAVKAENPAFEANKNFKKDAFNVVLGIISQLCLTLLPMYWVLGMHQALVIDIGIMLVVSFILKRTWWDKLED
jgi:putative flippase GtrA